MKRIWLIVLILLIISVGVAQSVVTPKIISVSAPQMTSGDQGTVTVNVQNIGDVTGSIDVSVSCDKYISQSGSPTRVTISPSQIVPVYVNVFGSATQNVDINCVATARDYNNANMVSTKAFTWAINTIVICTPGQKYCNGNTVQQCNSQGSQWVDVEVCPNGCMGGQCTEPEKGIFDNNGILTIILFVIALVLIYIAFISTVKKKHKK